MSIEPHPRLDSWKEIAAYLRCDERTAMRWQKSGLPVRHAPGRGRGRVFAYAAEIDSWLTSSKSSATGPAIPLAGTGTHLGASRSDQSRTFWLTRIPRIVQAGIIAAAAIGLFAGVSLIFRTGTAAPLAQVVIQNNRFQALDADGGRLWSYPLLGAPHLPAGVQPRLTYVGDLFGGSSKVVLTSLPFPQPMPGQKGNARQLFCFTETGELLWNFNPQYVLSYRSGQFGPPWHIWQWLRYRTAGKVRVAVVLEHEAWWPSLVVVLDPQGHEVGRFVNSGNIFSVAAVESASQTFLLVGGVNNADEHSAFLAVLDGENPSGRSPENRESEFACENCPAGHPLRYFVFPRSELNIVTISHFNRTQLIAPGESGISIHTAEYPGQPSAGADGVFEFTKDFKLKRAAWSDGYEELHRTLERSHKIDHSWEHCPDRFGPRVIRVWDPEHGWTEIRPNGHQIRLK